MINTEELLRMLQQIPLSEDNSGIKFAELRPQGCMAKRLDFSDSVGELLEINADFVNVLDLSEARVNKVVLIGRFNLIDLSDATIEELDTTQADIVILDISGATIGYHST